MYLAIIILPLLASISSGFFGRKIGVSGAQLISTTCIMITTALAAIIFFEVGFNSTPVSLLVFKWIDSESLNVFWGFNFDSLTVSMLIPVLVVSSLVHLYSIGYMSHDPHNQRFFSYLSLFTFMMIILVTANNFLLMFVGWEGVGICSYLLVSFWFTRIAANQSSMSAFLTNRVGDCLLTVGMFALLWSFGNIDYSTVFSLSAYMNENIITIIGVCLLIGAMAKSSQVGLHIWLPQAMEGPTPVSALIHAATMVTAGVYLLMRSSPLIEYSSTALLLCLWIGAITTVFSSLIGLYQQDIKKVIAYSTMSQLGMMVIAVGLSSYNVALFHLVNHAFYKALLFLGAGAVIHAVADNQDFRKYGGLKQFLPLTYSVMLIASLSLVAFPFMTGFYSKDFILESAFGQFCFSSIAVYFIATIGAVFTTLYSVKVLYLTFLSNPAGPLANYKIAHEGDIYMSLPLIILAFFSIFFGYFTKDIFIGLGTNFYADNGIFIHPNHEIMIDTEFAVPILFKLLPLILTITLSVLSLILSEFYYTTVVSFKLSKFGYNTFGFFNQRFYVELFYNKYIVEVMLKMGGQTTKVLDKGSIELIGPFGLERALVHLSKSIASLNTAIITNNALYILIGLITYILIPYIANYALVVILLFGLLVLTTNDRVNPHEFVKTKLESNFYSRELGLNILLGILMFFSFKLVFIILAKGGMFSNYENYVLTTVSLILVLLRLFLKKNIKQEKMSKIEAVFVLSFAMISVILGLATAIYLTPLLSEFIGCCFLANYVFLDLTSVNTDKMECRGSDPVQSSSSKANEGLEQSNDGFSQFTKAKSEINKELYNSKETLRRSTEKFVNFEKKANLSDLETKTYVDKQREFLNRFNVRIAELESVYNDPSVSSNINRDNVWFKFGRARLDYIRLANFNKAQEEAYHDMYSDNKTGLVRNRIGEYAWYEDENPTPTQNSVPNTPSPWKDNIRKDFSYLTPLNLESEQGTQSGRAKRAQSFEQESSKRPKLD